MKATKAESGYVVPSSQVTLGSNKQGLRCDNCSVYDPLTKTCTYVQGTLKDEAVCNLWTLDGRVDLRYLSGKHAHDHLLKNERLSYEEAGYISDVPFHPPTRGKGIRCGSCLFYNGNGGCRPVNGPITEFSCCNLWTEKDTSPSFGYASGPEIKALMPDIEDLF